MASPVTTNHEYGCGIHDLVYQRVKPGCPACDLQRRLDEVVAERDRLEGDLVEMRGMANRVRAASDLGFSMASAGDLLDARDRAFLKAVLYQWRETKDIDLNVTEDHRNFMTNHETHACSSVGGLAMAGFFAEAIMAFGRPVAMGLVQKAMGKHLAGGT